MTPTSTGSDEWDFPGSAVHRPIDRYGLDREKYWVLVHPPAGLRRRPVRLRQFHTRRVELLLPRGRYVADVVDVGHEFADDVERGFLSSVRQLQRLHPAVERG